MESYHRNGKYNMIENEDVKNFLKDLVAGGFSGIVAKTIIAPIERVKILLQTQHSNSRIHKRQLFTGPIHCMRLLYENEVMWAFWRGNVANVMSGAAGGTSMLLLYPLDVARTLMATDIISTGLKQRQFSGVLDSIYKSYKQGGMVRLYRGFTVSVTGAMMFGGLFFGGHDNAKYALDLDHSSRFIRYIVAQALTTSVGTLCYPLDTLKRRMMIQVDMVHVNADSSAEQGYMNGRECVSQIIRTEGVRGLFAGLSVNIVRGISGAVLLVLYDDVKKLLAS